MVSCCVVGCSRKRTSDNEDEFFKFPANKLQTRRWLDAIKLVKQPNSKAVVCSRHFVENDYKTVRGQRQLRALAVPAAQAQQKKSTRSNTVLTESEESSSKSSEDLSDEDAAPLQPVRETRNTRSSKRLNPSITNENRKKTNSRDNSDSSADRGTPKDKAALGHDGCDSISTKEDRSINEDSTSQNSVENKHKNSKKGSSRKSKSKINKKLSTSRDKETPNKEKQAPISDNLTPIPDKLTPTRDNLTPTRDKQTPIPDKQTLTRDSLLVKDPKTVIEHLNSELEKQIQELDGSAQIIKNSGKLKLSENLDDVHKDSSLNGDSFTSERTGPLSPDCEMMVERVQVDIDPDTLIMNEEDDDDVQLPTETVSIEDDKPVDPVSLLTSSDDDDVILQEPHIDTVEVSDETDEEDVPLKRLIKKPSQITQKQTAINKIIDVLWGKNDFFCYQCGYSTKSRVEYNNHLLIHTSVVSQAVSHAVNHTVFICDMCSFQSSSKNMMVKHKKKHKDEKKHKCTYCEYRAKHRMSLVYHMKSHQNEAMEVFKCQECGFGTADAEEMHDHLKTHKQIRIAPGAKKKKLSSKKRKFETSSSDDEYVPGND